MLSKFRSLYIFREKLFAAFIPIFFIVKSSFKVSPTNGKDGVIKKELKLRSFGRGVIEFNLLGVDFCGSTELPQLVLSFDSPDEFILSNENPFSPPQDGM